MLDNPLTGLDVNTRPFFHELLGAIAEKGTQLIVATSPSEISPCITHVLELSEGRVTGSWTREAFPGAAGDAAAAWQPDAGKLARLEAVLPPDTSTFTDAVRLEHIHVTYGETRILDDVNWEVKRGEKWALLGHNGAGKSTLLSLLSGDNPQAYANTIYLFDKRRGSGESIWDIKRKIGFLSPEMHQFFTTSAVCEDVILSGFTDTMQVIRKRISPDQRALGEAWMDLLEVAPLARTKFKEISAGTQRLVLLIRALVKNPPLLILDEPCQGLDAEQKDHFKRVIETLFADSGSTLIYVTHYAEEIPSCVTQVLRLENGKRVE
jgi:molybdate transport system ATP-binding protein